MLLSVWKVVMASGLSWEWWVSNYLNSTCGFYSPRILQLFFSMDSILWAASTLTFYAVVICLKRCVLSSAVCYYVCSCWKGSQQVVMVRGQCWQDRNGLFDVESLLELTECYGHGYTWISSVAVLCLSCAVMLALKFWKLKAWEVVCRAPLAHQGRLQQVGWHWTKRQAWGSCSSARCWSIHHQNSSFFPNLKFDVYCERKKILQTICV